MERWWYLSFADDGGWKGAAIVQGYDFPDAIRKTHRLKINPGGEIRGLRLSVELPAGTPVAATNRLLSRSDLEQYIGDPVDWPDA